MTETIRIISPIDGSVYAERPVMSDAALDAAVSAARAAQRDWRSVSVAERGRYVIAALEALLAMNDEIVPEIAWQMGRPTRYGGEKGGVEERTRAMVAMAEEALAPYVPPEREGFRRSIAREPLGVMLVIAPWNYPYLTAVNSIMPALSRATPCCSSTPRRHCWSASASPRRSGARDCPPDCSRTSSPPTHRPNG
jgi:acyl-CoA reductase-like NAD-dependent aldehyde dehydrogenase